MIPNFKKSALILSAIFAFTFVSLANENEIVECHSPGVIFIVVDKMPEFPGGTDALSEFIYPAEVSRRTQQGRVRVVLQFIVEVDGSITDIQVVRGIDISLDREAVRLVESMPNWIPGEQRGHKVPVRYTLPISFSLQ